MFRLNRMDRLYQTLYELTFQSDLLTFKMSTLYSYCQFIKITWSLFYISTIHAQVYEGFIGISHLHIDQLEHKVRIIPAYFSSIFYDSCHFVYIFWFRSKISSLEPDSVCTAKWHVDTPWNLSIHQYWWNNKFKWIRPRLKSTTKLVKNVDPNLQVSDILSSCSTHLIH